MKIYFLDIIKQEDSLTLFLSEHIVFAPIGHGAVVQGQTEVGWPPGSVILGVFDDLEGTGLLRGRVVEVDPVAVPEKLHPLRLPALGLIQSDLVHPANREKGLVIKEAYTSALIRIEPFSSHGEPGNLKEYNQVAQSQNAFSRTRTTKAKSR